MVKKNNKNSKSRRPKLTGDEAIIDRLERMSIGILYASTELGQNDISKIMGIGDSRVNEVLKGVKKPKSK